MGNASYPPELGGPQRLSRPTLPARAVDTAREIDDSKLTPKTSGTDVSFGSLVSLSRWHPFLLTFIAYARVQYWQLHDEVRKVDTAKRQHPRLFRWCRISDYVFSVVKCLLFTALAIVLICKLWNGIHI